MQIFEYTVIPAPGRGEKVRGARTGAERFSYALLTEMNRMAAQGWEYVRAETLPCEERSGLTSRTTVYHNVLVFRRALETAAPPRPLPAEAEAPAAQRPAPAPAPAPVRAAAPAPTPAAPAAPAPTPAAPAAAAAPVMAEPSADWPDGPEDDDSAAAQAQAARVDNYDEPGFDPEPAEAPAPPAFTRRPPLSSAQAGPRSAAEGDRPAFGQPMPGAHRLGPAER